MMLRIIFVCGLLILCNLINLINCHRENVLDLPNLGRILGKEMPGYVIDKYEAFLGIPFAQPPVGQLRFASPVPAKPWKNILNATQPKPDCIQKNILIPNPTVTGQEDCLYLNIYRPIGLNRKCILDVMVYIYGGGFFSGTANPSIHGPEYFMDQGDIILVTFSYRLGPFGFLSTGDHNIPGNFGLKDQLLALKWIQKNIEYFGGNPKNVTIFGQSAGAVSVQMHMISPASKGLFRHAICLSGNAGAPWNEPIINPELLARNLATMAGIQNVQTQSTFNLTQLLRKIDAKKLLDATDRLKYWQYDPLTLFRPVTELKNITDAFITESPLKLLRDGNYRHIPWLTGTVPFEGAVRSIAIVTNHSAVQNFNTKFDYLFEKLMELPLKIDNNFTTNQIINQYFHGQHNLNEQTFNNFGKVISDRGFLHPLYKNLQYYLEYANMKLNPVALYKFAYKGPYSYATFYQTNPPPSATETAALPTPSTLQNKNYGVVHCDDLIYLFKSPLLFPEFERNSTDAKVIKYFVNILVNFAKFGSIENITKHPMKQQPELQLEQKRRPLRDCTKDLFNARAKQNKICDYLEIRNCNQTFEMLINDEFDIEQVKFWDTILGN